MNKDNATKTQKMWKDNIDIKKWIYTIRHPEEHVFSMIPYGRRVLTVFDNDYISAVKSLEYLLLGTGKTIIPEKAGKDNVIKTQEMWKDYQNVQYWILDLQSQNKHMLPNGRSDGSDLQAIEGLQFLLLGIQDPIQGWKFDEEYKVTYQR